jgi:DNA recombination protein RmuC
MQEIGLVLVLGIFVVVLIGIVFFALKIMQSFMKENREQMLLHFNAEKSKATGEIDARKQEIENTVDKLQEQLSRYERMMKEFEDDRTKKFGSLEQQLSHATKETAQLQTTTSHLTSILANVKLRGQWGERMAEDILKNCGLLEGIQYEKQKVLDSNTLRPDYTFLLPDDHKVVMDVKFPLNRYLEFVNADDEAVREQLKKTFLDDVKLRIKEISGKDYLPAGESTLDYVLLFIPNEQVYGFINEQLPGLIDDCLKKRIILCAPWTLYAILKIIAQAWDNYRHSEGLKNIISVIYEFKDQFNKFKDSMESVGDKLNKAQSAFEEMKGVRTRQLDKKIQKIEQYGSGNAMIEQLPDVENE